MLDRTPFSLPHFSLADAGADYAKVREALRFITEQAGQQPGVEAIAAALSLSATDLTQLLRRWCGLTPKAFLQAVTLDRAKRRLDEGMPLLDCALDVGLSGPSRLHDLFVAHEALSPGEYKAGAAGLPITYGFTPSPFGQALLMLTPRGLCGLAFAQDEEGPGGEAEAFEDMRRRWPNALYTRDDAAVAPFAARIFDPARWRAEEPLRIILIGTDFEVRVWQGLLKIPFAATSTYSTLAEGIEKPQAARAVGAAVGRNPLSFVVPCHRVVGKSGALTGYHWGLTRKRAMLGWEAGKNVE